VAVGTALVVVAVMGAIFFATSTTHLFILGTVTSWAVTTWVVALGPIYFLFVPRDHIARVGAVFTVAVSALGILVTEASGQLVEAFDRNYRLIWVPPLAAYAVAVFIWGRLRLPAGLAKPDRKAMRLLLKAAWRKRRS